MSGGEDFVNSIMLQQGKVKINDPYLQGCGLRMVVSIPTEYPKNFPKHLTGMKACERLRKMTLEEAVSRWNQRVSE